MMDPSRDVVMGHEFTAKVLEVGDNVGNCAPGDVVVSLPIVMDSGGVHALGYSNKYPGGYGEQLILSDLLTMKVPNGLDAQLASLTEPISGPAGAAGAIVGIGRSSGPLSDVC